MASQEHVAREVSTLIERIVVDAERQADSRIDRIRQEHLAEMVTIRSQLEAQTRTLQARLSEQRELAASADEARSQLLAARMELESRRAELEAARGEATRRLAGAQDSAAREMGLRTALEIAEGEAERLTRQFECALEELRDEHVNTVQQQAVARTVLPLDELLSVCTAIGAASTPSALLSCVMSGLGREFSRVALFRVRGARLECVSHAGFDFEGDISHVVIPTTVDSLMARAVAGRRTQWFVAGTGNEPGTVPFGGTPGCAVALPLVSGDVVAAVTYVDDSDPLGFGTVSGELLVKFAELVWQYAMLALDRIAAKQRALAPPQSLERPA